MKSSTYFFFVGQVVPLGLFPAKRETASDPIMAPQALTMTCGTNGAESKPLARHELKNIGGL